MRQDARHNLPDLSAWRRGQDPYRHCRDKQRLHRHKQRWRCKMQLQMRLTYYMPK